MKKILVLLIAAFFAAGCKTETRIVEVKAPAPTIVPVSPPSTLINAKEHKPFTVTARILNPAPDLITYWIWKNQIIGYGTTVTVTPGEDDGGKILKLTLVAEENRITSQLTYQVSVSEVDDPPKILSYSPATTMVVLKTGEAVTFSVEGTDPDSKIVYNWYENGIYKASGNSFTLTATKATDGKKITLTGSVESNGKKAEVRWLVIFQHYDHPPEINLPVPMLFLSRQISTGSFNHVLDLTKVITDPDNAYSDLNITVETPPDVYASIENGKYLNIRFHEVDSDVKSIKLIVSDGEKTTEKVIPIIRDDYIIFKNENNYSLSIFGLQQLFSMGPVPGSEVSNVISTIATDNSTLYGFTTWGAYKLIKFSPISLQKQSEEDISYCASSPFDSVVWENSWMRKYYIIFTNFEKLNGKDVMSVYYPAEDTCYTYDLHTDNINQKMSYEGITINQNTHTLYLAATGYQHYDYQSYRSIFKNSYVTVVTAPEFSPTSPAPEVHHFKISNCVNLQSLTIKGTNLYGVCTGDYSFSATSDTGYLIKFSIAEGYPIEVTRISFGVGKHPVYIKLAGRSYNPYLLIGSSSGYLFVVTDNGNSLQLTRTFNFSQYGYNSWSTVVPVVVDYMAGASVSSWGAETNLFLSRNLLYPKDPDNPWTYVFSLGKTGASQWIPW